MDRLSMPTWMASALLLLLLGGCATRPVNPPITSTDPKAGYRFEVRQQQNNRSDKENLVILAFSGGGTRAAAFSFGVLEFLRRTEVIGPKGNKVRLLDAGRCHHRRVRRKFHRACLRPLRRKTVRRVRAAVPEAQCAGRDHRAHVQPRELGQPGMDRLGTLRTGVAVVRRNPVQRRDVRRPEPGQRADDPGVGHRHLDRLPICLSIRTSST